MNLHPTKLSAAQVPTFGVAASLPVNCEARIPTCGLRVDKLLSLVTKSYQQPAMGLAFAVNDTSLNNGSSRSKGVDRERLHRLTPGDLAAAEASLVQMRRRDDPLGTLGILESFERYHLLDNEAERYRSLMDGALQVSMRNPAGLWNYFTAKPNLRGPYLRQLVDSQAENAKLHEFLKTKDLGPVLEFRKLSDANSRQAMPLYEWLKSLDDHQRLLAGMILTPLRTLKFGNASISDLSPLSELTQLQTLHLCDTQVEDLLPLSGLTQLQNLDLENTRVSDLSPLSKLAQLQRLDLCDTQVEDLSPLAELTQLHVLVLSGSRIEDLRPLSELKQLRQLDLGSTPAYDLRPLYALPQLQQLTVEECEQLSDEDIDTFHSARPEVKIHR